MKGWQNLRLTEEDLPRYFGNGEGVGLLLGEASGGLTDVDLDCPEAIRAASYFLPTTGMVHGRPEAPSSHWWYRTRLKKIFELRDDEGKKLLEVRAGGQTLVPPSVCESGEARMWETTGLEPTRVDDEELLHAAKHLAAATLLARVWPERGRHDAALALSGALLRAGWGEKRTEVFIRAVCAGAEDEEPEDRVEAARTTAERLREGDQTTGAPTLAEMVGEKVMKRLGEWITVQGGSEKKRDEPSTPRVRCLADVEPQNVTWLWPSRIPRGKLSEIVGDPGEGKSWLVTELVGLLTTGRSLPGGLDSGRSPETVLLLSAEDGAGDTIRPRLDRAGADVSRVNLLDGIEDGDGNLHLINLKDPSHRAHLGHLVRDLGVTLLVIDPLTAYLGSTDSYRDSEVRGVLAPLAELAESTGAALLAIRHLNKGSTGKAIYRAGGSIGFTAAVRSSMLVGRVDEDSAERALVVLKSNLAPFPPPVGFSLEGGCFRWTGTPKVYASDLLRPDSESDERSDREETEEWLRSVLESGPLESKLLFARAKEELDVSAATVKRARRSMGDDVVVERESVEGGSRGEGAWSWRLSSRVLTPLDPLEDSGTDTLEQPLQDNGSPDIERSRGSTPGVEPVEAESSEMALDEADQQYLVDERAGMAGYDTPEPAERVLRET